MSVNRLVFLSNVLTNHGQEAFFFWEEKRCELWLNWTTATSSVQVGIKSMYFLRVCLTPEITRKISPLWWIWSFYNLANKSIFEIVHHIFRKSVLHHIEDVNLVQGLWNLNDLSPYSTSKLEHYLLKLLWKEKNSIS